MVGFIRKSRFGFKDVIGLRVYGVFWFIVFAQGLGRGSQFWVGLSCLLLGMLCLDNDIFGLGFWVFVASCGFAS